MRAGTQLHRIKLFLGLCLVLAFLPFSKVYAAQPTTNPPSTNSACASSDQPIAFNATLQAKTGTYNVYVRLGKPSQKAQVGLNFQPLTQTDCQTIGTNYPVTGDSWTKIGTWQSTAETGTFQLLTTDDIGGVSANRPSVMLVAQSDPQCLPTTECTVAIHGRSGVVRPVGTLKNEDSLYVVNVLNPNQDHVVRVDYYIDNKAAYTTNNLEPFNLRFVGPGKHTLLSDVIYSSGQRIIITDSADRSFANALGYYFWSLVYSHKFLLQLLAISVFLLVLWWLFVRIFRGWHRHKVWLTEHGAAPATSLTHEVVEKVHQTEHPEPKLLLKTKRLMPALMLIVGILAVLQFTSTFAVNLFQVNGPSMQSTLSNGDTLTINKLGKTWAALSNKPFVPKRGEMIVFQKAVSPLVSPVDTEKSFVVKRVIGLPGEHIVVKDGVTTVYNSTRTSGFQPDQDGRWKPALQPQPAVADGAQSDIDVTLQADELFVMGDNRAESVDSRSYGPVKTDQVVGNVVVRLTPLRRISLF